MTFYEWSVGMLAVSNPALAERLWATVVWVRRSCEAEGLPEWCTEMVVARVAREAAAGDFPLLTEEMLDMGGEP